MKRLTAVAMACGLFAAGSGCATWRAYPGPKRPRADVAQIEISSAHDIAVDGTAVEKSGVSRIELLPGHHGIAWTFTYPNRHEARKELTFHAVAGERYRLDQRFFAAPHPGGLLGASFDTAVDVALAPIELIFPPPAAADPPDGEYYCWIIHRDSGRVEAGVPPDVPHAHAPLTLIPPDEDEE